MIKIKIKIKEDSDNKLNSSIKVYFDSITIGSDKSDNILVKNSNINKNHIVLQCNEKGLICYNKNSQHYLSNGKRISGPKYHKKGDIITIGKTDIEIEDFSNKVIPKSKKIGNHKLTKILKNLKLELTNIKKNINVQE